MVFLKDFCTGFAITLGVEVALGLCIAIRTVIGGASKK